jgi:hypothetical protein
MVSSSLGKATTTIITTATEPPQGRCCNRYVIAWLGLAWLGRDQMAAVATDFVTRWVSNNSGPRSQR